MFGILNIDKPPAVTSRDVVTQIQRRVRPHKVGHAGTLDPLATGVLLVCVGTATRLVPYAQRLGKQYRATFRLGQRSSSHDVEEEVEFLQDAPVPSVSAIEQSIPQFVGEVFQQPPKFSALKVAGRRAYALARAGQDPQLVPRRVRIDQIQIVAYDYPELVLQIECGSGTYIRSIGRDLAATLGTSAVMSALTRTAVGDFRVEDAWKLTAEERPVQADIRRHLLPANSVVEHLPQTSVTSDEIERLATGQAIDRVSHGWRDEVAALDSAGELVAILRPGGESSLRPVRNFIHRG